MFHVVVCTREIIMRILLILLIALMPTAVCAASKDRQKKPETLEQASVRFFQELSGLIEKAGYKNITVAPHIFVLSADKADGRRIGIVVNTKTMQAMELENDPDFKEVAEQTPETYLPKLH